MSSSKSQIHMVITMEALCQGKSLQLHQASLSATKTNRYPWQVNDLAYLCFTAASPNLAKYDYFLVVKSLEAFEIFQGQCKDTPKAL